MIRLVRSVLLPTSLLIGLASAAAAQQAANTTVPATSAARGQAVTPTRAVPITTALRVTTTPTIDGKLDDAAWAQPAAITTFTQRDPDDGRPATEATEVWIAYDSQAVYVAARLHDRGQVTTRLGRRDMQNGSSDWFRVAFDSYHDRRNAYRFEVNPSGVRRDQTLGSTSGGSGGSGTATGGTGGVGGGVTATYGGPDGDLAWDAVWDAATSVDGDGWTAELRIPLSQLRFGVDDEQVWGLQVERMIDRNQELVLSSYYSKSELGGIAAYGELRGLRGLRAGRPLELVPYVLSQGSFAKTPNNPYISDTHVTGNVGLDARYRITSNITLSATANPDFGQVEVDPAVINLTAFETRFDEKRPFFVEGSSSFKYGGTVGGPSAAAASLLYTRRMGRAPQLDVASASEKDLPSTTTILGAVKLTGKTARGWSLGVLNAITGQEDVRYRDAGGLDQRSIAEPRSNYLVTRVNREFRRGQSAFGGMFTAVNRDLSGAAVDALREAAYSGGLDFVHEFNQRTWVVSGFLAGSRVAGSAAAIAATQRSSTRYFQRPDSTELTYDPTRTALDGAAATVQLRKSAGRHWTSDSWIQAVTPGFEINDMGFLQRSDRRAFGQGVTYNQRTPQGIFRDWRLVNYINYAQNFEGDSIDHFYRQQLVMTHLSYWQVDLNWWYEPQRPDDRFTRGGPLEERPANWRYSAAIRSDLRKSITGRAEYNVIEDRAGSYQKIVDTTLDIRTSPRWSLSLGPRYTRVFQDAQYVTRVSDASMTATGGARYVFAPLDQTEMSIVTRVTYTFSPNLSFELYAQPLVSHGDYGAPKEFQRPKSYEFKTYGQDLGTVATANGTHTVDPDGDGPIKAFTVQDRTFTTRSLRGNAVLRWEYRPGSTLFVVWQQDRVNSALMQPFGIGSALQTLFGADANNTLVVKWTYWMNP